MLLGRAPSDFAMPPQPLQKVAVSVPAGLPSTLLERRPDIAAAERAMAAANARVGAAKSAFFPRLDITGAFGYESSELGNLFQWSSRTFLLGPLVGAALSMPIFDGGRRQPAWTAPARSQRDVALYRQTVLNAFREVEDNLANLRILADQTRAQDAAVASAARGGEAVAHAVPGGAINYLDVIEADRSVLLQQRVSVQLSGEQARSAVGLIRALGGDGESCAWWSGWAGGCEVGFAGRTLGVFAAVELRVVLRGEFGCCRFVGRPSGGGAAARAHDCGPEPSLRTS